MYIASGVEPERVAVIPNGVDLGTFRPQGPALELPHDDGGMRFLFVGGLIWRKGPDVLLDAWREAFAGRDDVTLVVKDFGADSVYRGADRGPIREYAASAELPRMQIIDDELSTDDLAALYRACDVLVHPYRGEGLRDAGPRGDGLRTAGDHHRRWTDGRVLPAAGGLENQRSPSRVPRRPGRCTTDGRQAVGARTGSGTSGGAAPRGGRRPLRTQAPRRRCTASRAAALLGCRRRTLLRTSAGLAARRPMLAGPQQPEPFPLTEDVALRVLATPAWRGDDRLGELLAQWSAATTRSTSACLYLLADPATDGDPPEIEARVLGATAEAAPTSTPARTSTS